MVSNCREAAEDGEQELFWKDMVDYINKIEMMLVAVS